MTISTEQHRSCVGRYQHAAASKKRVNAKPNKPQEEKNAASDTAFFENTLYSIANTSTICASDVAPRGNMPLHPAVSLLLLFSALSQTTPHTAESQQPGVGIGGLTFSDAYSGMGKIVGDAARQIYQGAVRVNNLVARYDPVKFPVASAASAPVNPGHASDNAIRFLSPFVSEKLLTALSGWQPELRLDGELLTPFAAVVPKKPGNKRSLRRLLNEAISEKNAAETQYFNNHCNIRTKTVEGKHVGDQLLVTAEYVRNPLRALYETVVGFFAPERDITELETTISELANVGSDIGLGYFTRGAFPAIKYSSAQALKVAGHAVNEDGKCVLNDF